MPRSIMRSQTARLSLRNSRLSLGISPHAGNEFATTRGQYAIFISVSNRKTKYSYKGKRVLKIREDTGLNQTDFGARVGCSQDNISKIESGESPGSRAIDLNIIREFGVSEKWYEEGVGPTYVKEA